MKVKKEDMIEMTGAEFDLLNSALRMSREAIGAACGDLTRFAPGRWRQSGAIPKKHLLTLARILAHRSLGPIEFTANQKLAVNVVEQKLGLPLALLNAEGAAVRDPASAFGTQAHQSDAAFYAPSELTDKTTELLRSLPLEALINEIGRRGFKVQLEPSSKVVS